MRWIARRFPTGGLLGLCGMAFLFALVEGTHAAPADGPAAARLPNFIVILTDDQGYQDLGCFGSPAIKTPRIDQMAREGMRFTDFYVACPTCTGSRAALLTGCYPQRVGLPWGLTPQSRNGLSPREITIADLLKTRGYATACVGKWHLGDLTPFLPTRHGFDEFFGLPYSNDMDAPQAGEPPLPLMRGERIIEQPVDQDTLTERYTDEAIRFIQTNCNRPFFLYFPHTLPHAPLHVAAKFRGRSQGGLYGDAIECIDWSTGRILDALKALQLDRDTLIVYTSDNGPWVELGPRGGSAGPLRGGKATVWEGGMREPAVMWWPGRIPAGAICREVASTIDLLPTLARLAGSEPPKDRVIDGRNIWPLMSGAPGARSPHQCFCYYRDYALEAVRSGPWKLHFKAEEGTAVSGRETTRAVPSALYDLAADVGEQRDVLQDHPDVVRKLEAEAQAMREQLGDTLSGMSGKAVRPVGVVETDSVGGEMDLRYGRSPKTTDK
ncbi:MAG: sulfatase [Candidatus Sumerlaeota bacterium]|nr:sulfatase [Candidatus Sumerlaeota bacterium]